MKAAEKALIETRVDDQIMPKIKLVLPGILGFILRKIFPKLRGQIIDAIIDIVEEILTERKKQ